MEYSKDHDDIRLNRKVDGIGKAAKQDAPDSRFEILIPDGILGDAVVRRF